MIQLYQKINTLKVLSHFFKDPYTGFYLRELARIINMDPMTVKRALDLLVNDGFLEKYQEKNLILYRGDLNKPHFTFAKVSHSLSIIYHQKIVEHIMEGVSGLTCIVLYGSVSRGEDGPESDLDLLIIGRSMVENPVSFDLPWEFNPVFMTLDEWDDTYHENRGYYDEIVRSGINLHGILPVIE